MKTLFSLMVLLLLILPRCYGTLKINGNELLLRTNGIMHARRVRDTDNRHLEEHHAAPRRLARRQVIQNKKPKNILKNKKYKTI